MLRNFTSIRNRVGSQWIYIPNFLWCRAPPLALQGISHFPGDYRMNKKMRLISLLVATMMATGQVIAAEEAAAGAGAESGAGASVATGAAVGTVSTGTIVAVAVGVAAVAAAASNNNNNNNTTTTTQ